MQKDKNAFMKYYLRGLGTGLAVAVLLLGISGVNAKTSGSKDKDPGEVAQASVSEESKAGKESSVIAESSETIESSETVETSEVVESSETAETSETIESSETAETSEAIESSETVETSEVVESSETVETSEAIESSESMPSSETKEVTGEIQSSEAAEGDFTLTVQRGYSSWTVSKILAEAGVVADAKTYDAYLCSHGYDKRISVGTFIIPEGSSDEEIAKIITGSK